VQSFSKALRIGYKGVGRKISRGANGKKNEK